MKMRLNPSIEMVLQAASRCHHRLDAKRVCHVIIGGLAVRLHGGVDRGIPRDVDLLIRSTDSGTVQQALVSVGYDWNPFRNAAVDSDNGVRIDIHWNGQVKMVLPDAEAI